MQINQNCIKKSNDQKNNFMWEQIICLTILPLHLQYTLRSRLKLEKCLTKLDLQDDGNYDTSDIQSIILYFMK